MPASLAPALLFLALLLPCVATADAAATLPAGARWGQIPVAVDSMGDAPWTSVRQVNTEGFRPQDAWWRRALRAPGPAGWAALLGLGALLILLGGRARRVGRRRAAALVSALLFALTGALLGKLIPRLVPEPPMLRGTVQFTPRAAAPGTQVLYAWGESTMHGDVWGTQLSIPEVVGWALRSRVGGQPLAVQNLAEPGTSLTRGFPEGLVPIFEDKATYRPVALLLYVGHNAYYNLRQREGTPKDAAGLAAELRRAEALITERLRRFADLSVASGVSVFVALPVANRDGHPPMDPRHGAGVDPDAARRYEAKVDASQAALAAARPAAALREAQAAIAISPEHAWAHHLAGRALRGLGRDEDARRALQEAVTLDHNRQRVSARHRALIARLCEETALRCVDAETALRPRYPWLDDTAFIDLHHPVAAGHALIGLAFARALAAHLGEPAPRAPDLRRPPETLDPRAATFDRLVLTGLWYLVLARELRGAYPRARQEALARAEAIVSALRAARPALQGQTELPLSNVDLLHLLVAAGQGRREETAQRWRALRGPPEARREVFPEAWMRAEVAAVLGESALR